MSVSLRESKWQFARVGTNIFCLLICPECRGNSSSCLQAIQLTTLSLGSHVRNMNCTLLRISPLRMGKPAKTTNQEKPGIGWGILVPNRLHRFITNIHDIVLFFFKFYIFRFCALEIVLVSHGSRFYVSSNFTSKLYINQDIFS